MKGIINNFIVTIDKRQLLTLELSDDFTQSYDNLKDKTLNIEIKEHKQKRSLNANALLWKLCNEIGNKLRLSKEEIYLNMLKHYGQSEIISVRADVDVNGYFKYFEEIGQGKINGKNFTHYKIFKGSSEYDTQEMSILLDGVVQEAKEQGITVLSASELDLIKREWGS
ncbi:MAG: hypothetical protein WAN84_01015 [Acutalibacteraceae bacterium]